MYVTVECKPCKYYSRPLGALLILCLMFSFPIFAQNEEDTPIRIEFESQKEWSEFNYLSLGANGVVVINRGKLIHADTAVWSFTFYDTNFVKKQSIQKLILSNANLITTHQIGSKFFLLFQSSNIRKTPIKWYILKGNISQNNSNQIDLHLKEIFPNLQTIKSISALGENLILFSSEKNENGFIFYDLDKDTITFKVNLQDQYSEFIITDTTSNKMYICNSISSKTSEGVTFGFKLLEFDGSNSKEYIFPLYNLYSYKSARMVKIDTNSYLIIGTYSNESEKKNSNIHTGVYSLTFKNGIFGYPNFYNYTTLKTKDSQALLKGQSNSLNLQLVIGDVFTNNQQFAFITEVYYPEYTTTNYYSPGSYYVSTPVSTFDGYRFINAYITTFDKSGNLLWDNYMPISNVLTQSLYTKVGIHLDFVNNGYIYYLNGNSITSTLVNHYRVIEPLLTEKLTTLYAKDIVENSAQMKMERWYGDSYLVSGYQTIKNLSRGKGGKRYVFFLSRMQYR